ncbi:zincin [Tothia fuscella]|uniref:Zincin n=1 Tax=Tothia fuscella TaxID=1048955 RepID=A0A9P4P3Z8_9PEZI|nr:zincin [Tothia fuscella]
MKFLVTPSLLLSLAVASPLQPRQAVKLEARAHTVPIASESASSHKWPEVSASSFPIHESCNASQTIALEKGLADTIKLAHSAQAHLLRWGSNSPQVQAYFGNGTTATPIGWYQRVIAATRGDMLFRCDDPDQNCATQSGWAGHWRGSNATQETVICPLSFARRQPLENLCLNGYTVAASPLNTYWAVDLLHRLFHIPAIAEEFVEHYAEDYEEVLELAETNSTWSGFDSDALQYFAIDVYAYDVAAPGVGCTGGEPEHNHAHVAPSASQTATENAVSSTAAIVRPPSATPSSTTLVTTTAIAVSSTAAAGLAPSPTASIGCSPHGDHWHCEGPAPTSA